jgi:hypothetical protein
VARTHYSIRRRAAIEWACRFLDVDTLTPEARAVVEAFAHSEAIKSEYAADYLARALARYRQRVMLP